MASAELLSSQVLLRTNPLVGSTPKRETGGGTRYRLLASRSPAKSRKMSAVASATLGGTSCSIKS